MGAERAGRDTTEMFMTTKSERIVNQGQGRLISLIFLLKVMMWNWKCTILINQA